MNSLLLSSSFHFNSLSIRQLTPYHQACPQPTSSNQHRLNYCPHRPLSLVSPFNSGKSLHVRQSSIDATIPSDEGAIPVLNFEDFIEKDWSFLDSADFNSNKEYNQNVGRIISSGQMEESSRVMVSAGSEDFVDRLVEYSPCNLLLVVHDSLFVLAGIKEKYDKVKCWQGEIIYVPEKLAPLDVVFLYFLPASPFSLDQLFGALAKHCSTGARLVISHPQGREVLEKQKKQYPDVIVSSLPEKLTLQKVAADHSFNLVEFVDDPGFYLAVLKLGNAGY
ncbi:hypothetical protein UlMin_005120 [Ulmus minor]